jgi:hypothetical protein
MVSRLIVAAGLLSMVSACSAGPDEGTRAYFNSDYNSGYHPDNGYWDATYYNGRAPGRVRLPWE